MGFPMSSYPYTSPIVNCLATSRHAGGVPPEKVQIVSVEMQHPSGEPGRYNVGRIELSPVGWTRLDAHHELRCVLFLDESSGIFSRWVMTQLSCSSKK